MINRNILEGNFLRTKFHLVTSNRKILNKICNLWRRLQWLKKHLKTSQHQPQSQSFFLQFCIIKNFRFLVEVNSRYCCH